MCEFRTEANGAKCKGRRGRGGGRGRGRGVAAVAAKKTGRGRGRGRTDGKRPAACSVSQSTDVTKALVEREFAKVWSDCGKADEAVEFLVASLLSKPDPSTYVDAIAKDI